MAVVARGRLDNGELGLPSFCIVDVDAPGFTRQEIPMVNRGADKQWTLFFDKVELDEERLIGGYNGGLGVIFDGLNPERIMGASLALGLGRYALEKAAQYARERTVWSAPIGTHQGVAHPLAEAKIELELARLMAQKAAALYDAGTKKGAGEAANIAKFAAAEAGIKCVDQAIQTHGGNGFALEYGVAQLWWGARIARTAPVSREMILNYVAEHSLGQKKLHDAGWAGVSWPEEYGGRGATLIEQAIFNEEMVRSKAPPLANVLGLAMGGPTVIAHGTDEQKERFLPPILDRRRDLVPGLLRAGARAPTSPRSRPRP